MGGIPPVLHATDDAMLTPPTHFYIRKRTASFFPSGSHKMAAVRKSLRLMKQEPEIQDTAFKFFFLFKRRRWVSSWNHSPAMLQALRASRVSKAVGGRSRGGKKCAMCRQPVQIIPPAPAERALTNGQVVAHLCGLLNSEQLREELRQVSIMSVEDFLHLSDIFDEWFRQWLMVRNDRLAADSSD